VAAEDEVLEVSRAWGAALIRNDAQLVGGFMADDWVYVGPAGPTPRADILGWIASGRLAHHSMTVVDTPRVARVGDAVVLTARKTSTGSWEGQAYAADEWITEVYEHLDGRWRCRLSQKTETAAR